MLAPLLLGYAWLDDMARGTSWRGSLAVLVVGTVATLINPYGPSVWAYAAGIGTDPTITNQVSEWQRTSPLTVQGLLFYGSAVAGLAVAIRGRAALRWPDWLWIGGLFLIGAWAERGVAWWPLGLVYVLAPTLADIGVPSRVARPSRLNAIVAAAIALMIVAALPWWRPADPLTGRTGLLSYAPSGLASHLRTSAAAGARVFAPQPWASWFEWAVPDARYFVDSRFELFPADVWNDYGSVTDGGSEAAALLDRWQVSLLVIRAGGIRADGLDHRVRGRRRLDPHEKGGYGTACGWYLPGGGARDGQARGLGPFRGSDRMAGEVTAVKTSAKRSQPDLLDIVVLGGGGHVGLPLSLSFADAGLRVGVFDINQETLDAHRTVARCRSSRTARTPCSARCLRAAGWSWAPRREMIGRADTVVVVIGTPVDEFLGPSMRVFDRAVDQIAPHLRDGALVVLRSTVYPGTTEFVTSALADRGCRVDVAFCPERIAEGHALEELHSLPQIVGADDDRAAERAAALFGRLAAKTIRTSSKEAELTKLFTNTWRYMKFAVANQFFSIADQAGVDYTNVLRAIREDYPRAADLPGPGFAAGPCLFKDTMQLAAFTSDHFPLGQAAMQINEGMPAYIVSALERRHGTLRGRTVGHPGHGVQGGVGRHPRIAQLQAAQAARVGRGDRAGHR